MKCFGGRTGRTCREFLKLASAGVFFSTHAGSNWRSVETLVGNPKTFEWMVPPVKIQRTRYKVKVVLKDVSEHTVAVGASDGTFTINP